MNEKIDSSYNKC